MGDIKNFPRLGHYTFPSSRSCTHTLLQISPPSEDQMIVPDIMVIRCLELGFTWRILLRIHNNYSPIVPDITEGEYVVQVVCGHSEEIVLRHQSSVEEQLEHF